MSPRSRSASTHRSYSRSPRRHRSSKHKKSKHSRDHAYDAASRSRSISRPPPSPTAALNHALPGRNHRYSASSKSDSRSLSPRKSRRSRSSTRSHSRTSAGERLRSTRANPLQSRCIGVFGLSVHTTQQKIREIFSKFGPIERIHVVIDAQTGRSRGFCFIYYDDMLDARTAKDACSGLEIDNRRVRVDYSITQRPHTPTPGIYMGRNTKGYREYREYHDRYREDYRYTKRHYSPPPTSPSYSRSRSSHYQNNHYNRRRQHERSRSRSYSQRHSRY